MSYEEMEEVRNRAQQEGFDYCFTGYSDFPEITDVEFHKLRKAYVAAAEALQEYIGWGK
jgi:hypothetical protein